MLDLLEDWTYFCCSSQKSFMKGGTSVWSHPEKRETKSALSYGLFHYLIPKQSSLLQVLIPVVYIEDDALVMRVLI